MRHVQAKNTKPELVVRSVLHRMGYRFSLHRKDLPGKPDIVLPKYRTAIFVNGCFWHRHPGCKRATTPASNTGYWNAKFERNIVRDKTTTIRLKKLGWKVIIVWECDVQKRLDHVVAELQAALGKNDVSYDIPPTRHLFKAAEQRVQYE